MKRMVLTFCLTFICYNAYAQDIPPKAQTLTALLCKKTSCPNSRTYITNTPPVLETIAHDLKSSCPTPPIPIRGSYCKADEEYQRILKILGQSSQDKDANSEKLDNNRADDDLIFEFEMGDNGKKRD